MIWDNVLLNVLGFVLLILSIIELVLLLGVPELIKNPRKWWGFRKR